MDQNHLYRLNRKIITVFIVVLLLLIVTIDYAVLSQQYFKLQDSEKEHASQKLQLAAAFSLESILKDDLVAVEQFLLTWANKSKELLVVKAITPNGFSLVDFQRDANRAHTITVSESVVYQNKLLLELTIAEDISYINDSIIESAVILIVISVIVVSLFGYFLWFFLLRTAVTPLQQAVAAHILAEQALVERTKELEFSNQELETYSYSIAHDLRTPLRSITSISQILKEDAFDKLNVEEKDYLERITNAGKLMSELIFDILELSRISREQMTVSPVNLSSISKEILLYLENTWPDKNYETIVESDLMVFGDESALRLLMDNLLSNACKYSSKMQSPRVEVGVIDSKSEKPVFFVKDNGTGFNMEFAPKVFLPFQRLHKQTEYEGTGIGLATAKRIVEKHYGNIWVESEEGVGTVFYFTLEMQVAK